MSTNQEKSYKSIWTHYVASITPYRCAELIRRNEPLNITLINMFSNLLKKWLLICNRSEGIHLFLNRQIDEIHYLYQKLENYNSDSCSYKDVKNSDLYKWLESKDLMNLQENDSAPSIRYLDKDSLESILKKVNISYSNNDGEGLIIPFDYDEVNLGRFILWGKRKSMEKRKKVPYNTLLGCNATWYRFLANLFSREYAVEKNTYLPSYYSVGWKRAAVLFADIRNFTTLTEMLRNAYSYKEKDSEPLREIVNEYCSEMSYIIQKNNRGRIDKIMGDGIMALFGEYDSHPSKVLCKAVYVACEMVKKFMELKRKWEIVAFGKGYELEFNESVELDLGIGIDFGTVLFDYLGDDKHREYSVVGDHVNFAQRLEGAAAREDENTGEKRPRILLSRTALRCCKPWLKKLKELELSFKGKGHKYTCYGIEPGDFNEAQFFLSEDNDNWDSAWKNQEDENPITFIE